LIPPSLDLLAAQAADPAVDVPALLDRFWRDAHHRGTPLVEPADAGRCWVTFLWRAGVDDLDVPEPQRPVMVMGGPALWWQLRDNVLQPLPGTDILFRSYLVDDDLRGRYILSPGDPLTDLPAAGTPESVVRSARFRPDHRNQSPLTLAADPGDPLSDTATYSTFALPAATPARWSQRRPGVSEGTVTEHRVPSAVLGNTRRVWTYLPAASAPQATLIMLDGRDWMQWVPLTHILDNLVDQGEIPPVGVILPEALDTRTRYAELTANPAFTDFLVDELLPWARRHLPVADARERLAVHGKSFGGLAAVHAAITRPEVFGAAISQSGSFWFTGWDGGTRELLPATASSAPARDRSAPRVSLDIGRLEGEAMLGSHARMAAALRGSGHPLREHEYHGGHDINCWISELPAALRWWTEPFA
jgi:enterochelin esterase family protein